MNTVHPYAHVTIQIVWTDGLGNFQAQCRACRWTGPWRESGRNREKRATEDAKQHGQTHTTDPHKAEESRAIMREMGYRVPETYSGEKDERPQGRREKP
jgi:hypothetical protein